MIRNYIIITLRNFLRNRNYTLINILGLSIGITCCIIIFLLIRFDLNFDRFHSQYDNIYRVVLNSSRPGGIEFGSTTPYPFVEAFRNDYPQIPLATQFHYEEGGFLRTDKKKVVIEHLLFADSLFFEVFDFPVRSGNPRADLAQPAKAFVTESLAKKLNYEAGQQLTVSIRNKAEVDIVGILADVPATSHIQFEMVVSMPTLTPDFVGGFPLDQWGMTAAGFTYIVLPENVAQAHVEESLVDFVKKYFHSDDVERKRFALQPLSSIHSDERYTENPSSASNVSHGELRAIGLLGIFILLIACINFINLSTALAVRKSREIGVRKTLGADRKQLALYFIGETFLITCIAVLISLGVAEWLTPWVSAFTGKELALRLFSNTTLALFIVALVLVTSLLSGFYPAMVLSGFSPVQVLKNKITSPDRSGVIVRKVLVVFQFVIAQLLIIGMLIISDQLDYFLKKDLGFKKEAILIVEIPDNKKETLQNFKDRLLTNPSITSVSFSLGAPTSDNSFSTNFFLSEKGSGERSSIGVKPVDIDYLSTYGIELLAGRWFTPAEEKAADRSLPEEQQHFVYLVNEAATRQLGFHDPAEIIGKNITTGLNRIDAPVIGVVKDFHVSSLHNEIVPVVLIQYPFFYHEGGIKINTSDFQEVVAFVEAEWIRVFPDYNFEYAFLDQNLERLYRQDQRTFTLVRIFAGVSIFVACLGLYGLVSFMTNQKMKEVGIRKVMGATVVNIVTLFSRDFIRLIVIAFGIAAPLGWYLMTRWLEAFAYHISIGWTVFIISVAATLFIALATVSYRSVRAAISNPAETLRTE